MTGSTPDGSLARFRGVNIFGLRRWRCRETPRAELQSSRREGWRGVNAPQALEPHQKVHCARAAPRAFQVPMEMVEMEAVRAQWAKVPPQLCSRGCLGRGSRAVGITLGRERAVQAPRRPRRRVSKCFRARSTVRRRRRGRTEGEFAGSSAVPESGKTPPSARATGRHALG